MADPLIWQQGIDFAAHIPIVDADGDPADLTGYTAACQVRKLRDHTSELLGEMVAYCAGGDIVITQTAEISRGWTWKSGYFDVILIDPSGRPVEVIADEGPGQITLRPVITVV